MREENELIIKQLNKFGRVPQTYELLKMIEQLETNWKELKKWIEDLIDKNNDIYELYKDDILHHDYEINNARYQNNILLAILNKMQELENKNENN